MSLHARIPELGALAQVLLIDVVLAGDNAIVVGLAVAGLPRRQQRIAIVLVLAFATVIRVACALAAFRLLQVIGLTLAGGVLLLWICWRMYRELRRRPPTDRGPARRTLGQAMLMIAIADLSMSLDNVLAVAGAAQGHLWVLVVGLGLAVVLMGVAAGILARMLERYRWIAWVGVLVVFYVAIKMIWEGTHEVAQAV
jgi:YjbE family integral membrane protein